MHCQHIKKVPHHSWPLTDLEVTVHDAHVVEVFDSIQNLLNELTGIFLCVEAFLYDTIEEFPSRNPALGGWKSGKYEKEWCKRIDLKVFLKREYLFHTRTHTHAPDIFNIP